MRAVHLVGIRATAFRNLSGDPVGWCRSGNLLVGRNGQGKSNLLEAVTVLGNLRSFRGSAMRQMVAHGAAEFFLEGRVETTTGAVRLSQRVEPGPPVRRQLEVAGSPASVPQYLQILPVIALSGADRELVVGPPSDRRAFLDRFAFLLEADHFRAVRDYRRLLRQRNAGLVGAADDREMEVWESRLARAAAEVVDRRQRTCRRLLDGFRSIYDRLRGEDFPDIDLHYRGEAGTGPVEGVSEVEEDLRKRYNETRARDRRTGFTGEGPHRHDLGLRANGRVVRHVLSSGQIKVVAAALRLASLLQIEQERGELLPVLIDDVDAELDPAVLARLIGHLDGERQLFLSSADPTVLAALGPGSSRFEIWQGRVHESTGVATDE